MRDKYSCYRDLALNEQKNRDFSIWQIDRGSPTTILAPHGGKIEARTSEIAIAIADKDFNLYCFEGIKGSRNHETLHITSHRFDEPQCLQLVSRSHNVIAIHGNSRKGKYVFVGGLKQKLRRNIVQKLRCFGYRVKEDRHGYLGQDRKNVCNRGLTKEGVQLELTISLRRTINVAEFSRIIRSAINDSSRLTSGSSPKGMPLALTRGA